MEAFNERVVLLPNAADTDVFDPEAGLAAGIPPPLASLPPPRVGYFGEIASWFDAALVAAIARSRPSWSIVLVGPARPAEHAALASVPNVHLLGAVPHHDLPAYGVRFDACLLPFKHNRLTAAASPIKLYEYLALGRPVVSTLALDRRAPEGLLDAVPAEGVLAALERAIADRDAGRAARRRRWVEENTWETRTRTALEHLA
jgi:glycosyltransferase involved in cell wall biosynthesis